MHFDRDESNLKIDNNWGDSNSNRSRRQHAHSLRYTLVVSDNFPKSTALLILIILKSDIGRLHLASIK